MNIKNIIKKHENKTLTVFEWFENNSDKIILTTDDKPKNNAWASFICNKTTVKLFGMTVDNKLSFELHLNRACKKVSHKLHALAIVSNHIKLRIMEKASTTSQFGCCVLV